MFVESSGAESISSANIYDNNSISAVCVGLSMRTIAQSSNVVKELFELWELLCELGKVKTARTPICFCSLSSFMGYEVACVCMCMSVWRRPTQKAGWDAWERVYLSNIRCSQKPKEFCSPAEIHILFYRLCGTCGVLCVCSCTRYLTGS